MTTTIIDGLVLDGSTTGPQGLDQTVFTDVLATKPVTVTDLAPGDVITWDGTEFVNQIPAAVDPNVVVLRSTDQTINSVKTFSVSPLVPTVATGDDSAAAASTAFVKAQNYITGNQTITFTGDATGSGQTSVTLTLSNSGVTAGTYNDSATAVRPFTVDSKGRITSIGAAVTITPAWSSITSKPTTISTFGITDAYTKAEVDAAVYSATTGLDPKDQARAIATSNITLSGTQVIDGVSVIAGDRVLVVGQTTASQNGIYVVAAGAWSRSTDANSQSKVTSGMYVFVSEGTVNQNSGWYLTTDDPITLGTTALNFVQFTGAGQITAGTGLTKTGNTLALTGQALSLHNLGTLGFTVRTATDTITARSFAVSGSGITVANPAGTAGDPTFSLTAALSQIGALTPAADRIPYYTGASAAALATLTSFARTLLDDADAATARTTLGLGSIATQSSSQINITGGSITGLTTFDAVTIDCGTF